MIQANHISIGYKLSSSKNKVIHSDVSFSLMRGELTAMLGANGAGKSTLIKTLCGFIPTIKGCVELEGENIHAMKQSKLSKKVGVVLTDKVADGGLTVYDLVSLGRYPHIGYFASLSAKDHQKIDNALNLLNISHLRDRYISRISDGERQRAMIAKTIAQECDIIILDEPTAFLDAKSRLETFALLREIAKNQNKTILISTHDLEIAIRHADRLMILSKEKGLIYGTTEDVVLSGNIEAIFNNNSDKNFAFDIERGLFQLNNLGKRLDIVVKGEGKEFFWLKNSLERNGYQVIKADDNSRAKIEIIDSTHICVDGEKWCSSIEEMLKLLISN